MVNATVGFVLFFSYSATSSVLTPMLDPGFVSSTLLVPFLSGGVAGAAQSIISTPLDNARILLLRRQRLLAQARAPRTGDRRDARTRVRLNLAARAMAPFTGWLHLLRDAVSKPGAVGLLKPGSLATAGSTSPMAKARAMASNGFSAMGLVAVKDGVSFGSFFLIFSLGRRVARMVGLRYDGLTETPDSTPSEDESRRRSPTGIILQSLLILASGGVAGWVFSLVARPFDRARAAIMEGQEDWARQTARREAAKARAEEAGKPARGKQLWEQRRRVQLKRRRAVGRTFNIKRRRRVRKMAGERREREAKARERARTVKVAPTLPAPRPPSELELVRKAAHRFGGLSFFLAASPTQLRKSRITLLSSKPLSELGSGSAVTPTKPSKPPRMVGPTRLSARGHRATTVLEKSQGGWLKSGMRVLSFVPPYAVGFTIYAVLNGDLGT